MSEHEHRWWPVPLEMGEYVCGCGASGYRAFDGQLRAHKKQRAWGPKPTVLQNKDAVDGHVPPKPGAP